MKKINLLISDDQEVFRKGLETIIRSFLTLNSVHHSDNGFDTIALTSGRHFDIALIDHRLPGMNGLDTIKTIRRSDSGIKLIFVTAFDEPFLIRQAFQSGANGFLNKACTENEIREAIFTVRNHDKYISPNCSLNVDQFESVHDFDTRTTFSNRETQVLSLIAEGKTSLQISSELGLSIRTVEAYRFGMMKKVGVMNVAQLLTFAYKNGLV